MAMKSIILKVILKTAAYALLRHMLYENVTCSLPKVLFKLDSDLQTFFVGKT